MAASTKIEWAGSTWNPVTGCTKVSEGCRNCYADSIATRFEGTKGFPDGFKVTLRQKKLTEPLRWRKPRRIFVCSMADLFHEDVPDWYLDEVFAVLLICHYFGKRHVFQVLTKRPGRMQQYLSTDPVELLQRWSEAGRCMVEIDEGHRTLRECIEGSTCADWGPDGRLRPGAEDPGEPWRFLGGYWPLPNLWMGVSVEDQATADQRIPILLQTPAALRWASYEPALGPVDLRHVHHDDLVEIDALAGTCGVYRPHQGTGQPLLGWVVAGGESGPGSRPAHPDWFRSVRDQCAAAEVPFLFKQWGDWAPGSLAADRRARPQLIIDETGLTCTGSEYAQRNDNLPRACYIHRAGKKAAGRELDGRTHDEFPGAGQ